MKQSTAILYAKKIETAMWFLYLMKKNCVAGCRLSFFASFSPPAGRLLLYEGDECPLKVFFWVLFDAYYAEWRNDGSCVAQGG